MTLSQLEDALRERAPEGESARAKWNEAVTRLMSAASPPDSFDELAEKLPCKARYVGPGPWLDAIRDSCRS